MDEMTTTSLRLERRQAEQLAKIAEVSGTSFAEETRLAIEARIQERKKDPEFQRLLKESIDRSREVLRELAPE